MKEILQVKLDLASIFILLLNWVVLELLDCSNDSRQFMFSEFPHLPCRFMARPLKLAVAFFPGDQIAVSESF